MKKIIIVGSSGHAKVVIDTVERSGKYQIVGLLDDFRQIKEKTCSYKILGKLKDLSKLRESLDIQRIIVAVGDNYSRFCLVSKIKQSLPGLKFATIIDPMAAIGREVIIGEGSLVFANASVKAHAIIGEHCIVNNNCSFGHDTLLGDFSSIGPCCAIGGNVLIGEQTAIGIGSTILEKVEIGDNTIIGAGAVVTRSLGSNIVAYGNPARFIRNREESDSYLK